MSHPAPHYLLSVLSMKCPRCRRAAIFKTPNPWKWKQTFRMHDDCPLCKQHFDMEPGFWYGTAYVSYALTVAFSVATFIAWWVLIGLSTDDNRLFWWLGLNAALLLILQPWFIRISRVIWLYFFIRYDVDYDKHPPRTFDYHG